MRFPRLRLSVEWVEIPPRFSVRHLIIVVAIVAVTLGLAVVTSRRGQYLRLAKYHARSSQGAVSLQDHLTGLADRYEGEARTTPGKRIELVPDNGQPAFSRSVAEHAEHLRGRASHWSRMANYHGEPRREYAEAASRPWQFISSDPPPPSDPLQP